MEESRCISLNLAALLKADRFKILVAGCCVFFLIASLSSCTLSFSGEKRRFINYPVARGDTLFELAQRFQVSVEAIQEANSIDDERALQVGSVLKIPYNGQAAAKAGARPGNGLSQATGIEPHSGSLRKVKLSVGAKYIGKMLWPVGSGGGRLSSMFGWRWFNFHEGIDISAAEETGVYAAHSGKVIYSGTKLSGYGNIVVIKGDGLLTVYGHNKRNRVKTGDAVDRGDRIADVGMSGKANGPHLHFETRIKDENGKYAAVDPLVFYQKAR